MKEELKINDNLWNAGYPMMKYEVRAVIKREKNTQYELFCETCNHGGENCRILITKDDYGNFVYVAIVNEDDEDKRYYFHINNGNFYTKKELAETEKVKGFIKKNKEEIEKAKSSIEYNEKEITKYEDRLKSYEELLALSSLQSLTTK